MPGRHNIESCLWMLCVSFAKAYFAFNNGNSSSILINIFFAILRILKSLRLHNLNMCEYTLYIYFSPCEHLLNHFIYLITEKGRVRDISHLLVYSLNGWSNQGWARPQLGDQEIHLSLPYGFTGCWTFFSTAFPGALAESWIKSGAAGNWAGIHMVCWHCRGNLAHYATVLDSHFYFRAKYRGLWFILM